MPVPGVVDVHRLDLLVGQSTAERTPGGAREAPDAYACRLRQAVAFNEGDAGGCLEAGTHGRGQRTGSDHGVAQAADVGVHGSRGERGVDGRDGAHGCKPVLLDKLPEDAVEGRVAVAQRSGPHDRLALEEGSEDGDDEGIDVEQRQGGEVHGVLVGEVVGCEHPGVGDLVGVGVCRQLRGAGRAAGVEECRQIVLVRADHRGTARTTRLLPGVSGSPRLRIRRSRPGRLVPARSVT